MVPGVCSTGLCALLTLCGMQALQSMARSGTLLHNVLQFDEQPMPVPLRTLIGLCLQPDPAARPTASRLAAALEHIRDVLPEDNAAK